MADLEVQRSGDVVAALGVRVAEEPLAPGRARATFTLTVDGPPALQLGEPRLEDAFAAWRIAAETSSWARDVRASIERSIRLEQIKAGAVPLPGVRLRVRGGPTEDWRELSWPEPLHSARDVMPVVVLPSDPPSPWPSLFQATSIGLALTLAALFAIRLARRRLRPAIPTISPVERAVAQLDDCPDLDAISSIVRRFLDEHLGFHATRSTTAELLDAMSERGIAVELLERLRRLLEQGDLEKFAGASLTLIQTPQARALAADCLRRLATQSIGETESTGEAR